LLRPAEIEKFVAREYWSLVATLATPRETFKASGRRRRQALQRLTLAPAPAEAFKRALETGAFSVASIEAKPAKRHPPAPFTTSTLQQEASRNSLPPPTSDRATLYEGIDVGGETIGLITYMRTDGVQIAEEAITATAA
jgi:DNA topoisomerase-1